uniref:Xylanase inhibitor N-terminal domain-containing protein n=1 Tax=Lactuca sativa TaxID=4236 RepID=A0A9R1XSW7_LACSA|nr:hypothetical protein LSAT_V11C100041430 [Lactuca sativa]
MDVSSCYANPNVFLDLPLMQPLLYLKEFVNKSIFPVPSHLFLNSLTCCNLVNLYIVLHKNKARIPCKRILFRSDLLWVGCKPYQSCPTSSTLQQNRQRLLLSYARTKDVLKNPTLVQITNAPTISTMEMVVEHQTDWLNISASVLFGSCSTSETGDISQTERTLDGIMGLGRQSISIISQISSQGIAPNSFGHCLAGGDGGGISAFDTAVMPDLCETEITLDGIMGFGRQSISVISQISSQGIAPNSFRHCLAGGDGGEISAFGTLVMPDLVFTPLVKSM